MASVDGNRPAWSERRGILSFAGVVTKRFAQPAENQRAILRAFEQQGWPEWIADPLPHDHDKDGRQRLADAVYKLNRHQENRLIRFRRDGMGTGILWELVKKKK